MVSACDLFLDDLDLTGQKASVPDFLSGLFQESDRIEDRDEQGDVNVVYRATRESVLKRLSVMGCTESLAKRRFEDWRTEQITNWSSDSDFDDYRKALELMT